MKAGGKLPLLLHTTKQEVPVKDNTIINMDWEEIGISNDFLFGKVMQEPELCKELLKRILPELDIIRVEYPELQKTIKPDADAKSVRLDVYVNDDKKTLYDIEMQATESGVLSKRSRYYQSMIDLQLIDKGQPYSELNRSYVIFICLQDIFGKGRHIYTFENICREDTTVLLRDEATKIFLNANGTMDDVSKELRAFLDYVAGKSVQEPEDTFIQKLEDAVNKAKCNLAWSHEYMTLFMRDQENLEKGHRKGKEAMVLNVLETTASISHTATLMKLEVDEVRQIARENKVMAED